MNPTAEHANERQAFFNHYPNFWSHMYGEEYAVFDVHPITPSFAEETRQFARDVGSIFFKTAHLLQSDGIDDDTLLSLGFPHASLPFLRLQTTSSKTIIGRLDSVLENGVHKVMEFNSDTPAFLYELFHMNGEIARNRGFENPNAQEIHRLSRAVEKGVTEAYGSLGTNHFPHIVFTSHADHQEDEETIFYLQSLCPLPSVYEPLDNLSIVAGVGLYDGQGQKIDVLYRHTFPIDQLVNDVGENGEPIGFQLLDLVVQKKVAIVNPPSAFLLQSKALLAVIWGLHEERSPFFTDDEHAIIKRHFLPTYLEPDLFLEQKQMHVRKPCFGREGDSVEIYDGYGQKVEEDKQKNYQHYTSVYQRHVSLPKTTFQTEKGRKEGHMMFGTFLVDGEASAFGIRVGNAITDNLSYFLPVGLEK